MAPKLPQELFDRLIDFIALGEEVGTMDDLKSCSLIAKSWARTSQRHILKAISIPSFDRLFAWASEIDLARGTSSCVRTVTLCGEVARRFSPEELAGLEPHLSAFVNLECLNLIKFHLHSGIEHAKLILNSFGLFRTKLNTLQLESCSLSPNVFQSFLHLFPRLDNVHIGKGCLAVIKTADDILLRPPLGGTKNLRGSLVTETDTPREFFPCLLTIPLHFHHLECILSKESHEVISACAATLELLSFAGDPEDVPINSIPFPKLHTLEFWILEWEHVEPMVDHYFPLIESAPNFSAVRVGITEATKEADIVFLVDRSGWERVDEQLCRLAETASCPVTLFLETVSRLELKNDVSVDLGGSEFLPRFRKAGGLILFE